MKKLFILMNCQGVELLEYFNRIPEFQREWEVRFFSSYEMSEIEGLISALPEADCLLTHNIKSVEGMRYDDLTPYLRRDAQVIKLEYWRANVFWPIKIPHTWGGFWFLPEEYGSVANQTFDQWTRTPISKSDIVENFEREYDRLVAIDRLSDIKIAHLFEGLYRDVPTFSDYNHPTSYFFWHVTNIVLDMIGVKSRAKLRQNSGLNAVRWRLVPDDVMEALDLKFDRDNIFFHYDRIDRRTFFEFSRFLAADYVGQDLTIQDISRLFKTFSEAQGLSYKDLDVLTLPTSETVTRPSDGESQCKIFDLHGYRPISGILGGGMATVDLSIDGRTWTPFDPQSVTGYATTEDLPLARYVRLVGDGEAERPVKVFSPLLS